MNAAPSKRKHVYYLIHRLLGKILERLSILRNSYFHITKRFSFGIYIFLVLAILYIVLNDLINVFVRHFHKPRHSYCETQCKSL